jgi:hypothetical protein
LNRGNKICGEHICLIFRVAATFSPSYRARREETSAYDASKAIATVSNRGVAGDTGNPSRTGRNGWGPVVPRGGAVMQEAPQLNLSEDDNLVRIKKVAWDSYGPCARARPAKDVRRAFAPALSEPCFRRMGTASRPHRQGLAVAINFPAPTTTWYRGASRAIVRHRACKQNRPLRSSSPSSDGRNPTARRRLLG